MKIKQAINIILDKRGQSGTDYLLSEALEMAVEALTEKAERCKADGCNGCAYYGRDLWEMPCAKCSKNCKNFWRKGRP